MICIIQRFQKFQKKGHYRRAFVPRDIIVPPFANCKFDPLVFQVIIAELLSLATIVAYIICSLFWKSTSAAYESLDSNTEDEGDEEVTNKNKFAK